MLRSAFHWLWLDLSLGLGRSRDSILVLGFFVLVVLLFPLALGPDPQRLREVAPGVLWTAAVLSVVLATPGLFDDDHREGLLDQWLLASVPLQLLVALRLLSHWLLRLAPLVILSPLLGLMLGLDAAEIAGLTLLLLLLGTPLLLLLAAMGAALTLGLRNGGLLTGLLVLPLMVPVLIAGSSGGQAALDGASLQPWYALLGGLLILASMAAPFVIASALRIMLD